MKNIFFFTLLLLGIYATNAQYTGQIATNLSSGGAGGTGAAQINSVLGSVTEIENKLNKKYDNFQGSPYVTDVFLPTNLFYNDENLGTIYYRYNALNEEIEIKKTNLEEEPVRALARDKAINILVNEKKMSFKTFVTSKNKTLNGYLITIIDGKTFDLYKRIHVKYTEGTPASNSFVKAIPNRFSQFTEYYFQKEGINRMDEIKIKNSSLFKLFEGKEKQNLKQFVKENDLNIKNEEDLIKVFDFLNE